MVRTSRAWRQWSTRTSTRTVRYLDFVAGRAEEDIVVLLLPEYVPHHWWERYLYNENARRIRDALLGRTNILIADVPYRREA
jgi:hypothetical protein